MRVLFVTHSYPRRAGDVAGGFVLRLAVALRAAGVDVHVLAPSGVGLPMRDVIDDIPVERFRYAPDNWETLAYDGTMAEQVAASLRGKLALTGMLVQGARAVRRAVTRLAPDVVHAHWWFPSGVSCAWAGNARPLVVTLHGSDVRLAEHSTLAQAGFRYVAARAAVVSGVSAWLATRASAFSPTLSVSVAPMPVDLDLFRPGSGAPTDSILFVGRLNAQKGVRDLLGAMPSTSQGVTLDIVGDGADRGTLEDLSRSLKLEKRVRWHGALPQRAVAPLYRSASVVAIPSRNEGLGLVAVESLLSGVPVVAYRSGGVSELVEDGETGLLVPPGDVRAFAAALNSVITNRTRAREMGELGRERMALRFAPAAAAAAYARIYERVAT